MYYSCINLYRTCMNIVEYYVRTLIGNIVLYEKLLEDC
jgi:hypothetical protein